MNSQLLHAENLSRIPITGKNISDQLSHRVLDVVNSTQGLSDPSISVVIRSRNNAGQLKQLLIDISNQEYSGDVEIILVDTQSTDGTIEIAKKFNAKIVSIKQKDFNYPKALNLGFEKAKHEWVLCLVDHSLLTNKQIFRIATRYQNEHNIAGISGITLPNSNAKWFTLITTAIDFPRRLHKSSRVISKIQLGTLATNASLINRNAWKAVGGFDESYGAGGEDGALASTMIKKGYKIIVDPAMSVYHSHDVGLIDGIRQQFYWLNLRKPLPFDRKKLIKFRSDLK